MFSVRNPGHSDKQLHCSLRYFAIFGITYGRFFSNSHLHSDCSQVFGGGGKVHSLERSKRQMKRFAKSFGSLSRPLHFSRITLWHAHRGITEEGWREPAMPIFFTYALAPITADGICQDRYYFPLPLSATLPHMASRMVGNCRKTSNRTWNLFADWTTWP